MGETKAKSEKGEKGKKGGNGGGSLDSQIANLRTKAGEAGTQRAEELAAQEPREVVALAFKIQSKQGRQKALNKAEQAAYEGLLAINPEQAEQFKQGCLAKKG